MRQERYEAFNKDRTGGEFDLEREPRCPHCGEQIDIGGHDLFRIYTEGDHKINCPDCHEELLVQTEVIHQFATNPIELELDDYEEPEEAD